MKISQKRIYPLLIFVLCAPFLKAQNAVTRRKPIPATVCQIAATPKRYARMFLSVKARLESDGIERSALMDDACPGFGLALDTSSLQQGADVLVQALRKGRPGTVDKIIDATFIGTFLWMPGKMPSRKFAATRVNGLTVVMK